MKRHALALAILLLLSAVLAACSPTTALNFSNETQCGTATITLTTVKTGNVKEYSVEQGKELKVELEPAVEYRYEVEYPRTSDRMQCDTKRVTTALEKGTTVNVRLTSVLDESLINATATAEASTTTD